MEFNLRKLNSTDYEDILVGWWKDWGWEAIPKDFLPEDGEGGVIIFDGEVPVCAGFMYATNSKVAWIEFIISNKQYDKEKRKKALVLLVDALNNVCKNGGFVYVYSILKNKSLIETYESQGYIKGDSNFFEMIKKL